MFSFFLTEEMKCVIAIGKDACGFETRRIEPTWGTRRRLERLFAALRSFYCLLISKGRYDYTNPLEGDRARELIEEERHRFITQFSKRSEEHTSELPSLMRITYAVFCWKKKTQKKKNK